MALTTRNRAFSAASLTRPRRATIASLIATAAALAFASPAAAADCTKVASPSGSDAALGTPELPFRTAQKLAYSLRAGDVGCLHAGTYHENVELTEAGTGSAPIVLQSYPGERATILGELAVRAGADHTTVASLDLNGRNPERWSSPAVSADHVVFEDNDVTNDNTSICFLIGTGTRAHGTIIRRNRIHDCGKLPATNLHEGIYVQYADDTQILDNLIYDNADQGIQLYPDAQRTLISGNVIDGNGEGIIFGSEGEEAANDNVVENNVITNSKIRDNVESYYHPGHAVGHGNIVRNNCLHGGPNDDGDGGISREVGFRASGTIVADPQYVDRAGKDFRLADGSPCAGVLAGGTAPGPVGMPAPGSGPTSGHVTLRMPVGAADLGQLVPARGAVVLPASFTRGSKRRVLVQRRTRHGWRTVARAKVGSGSRFRTRVRVRAKRGQHVVRMRATVRHVASSQVRRVKVRRAPVAGSARRG